jgi:hypothetical protein
MAAVLIKHMLTDYEKWKLAINEMITRNPDLKITGYKTEMDRTNPKILTTKINLRGQENDLTVSKTESIQKIFDANGLHHKYEIHFVR